MITFRQLAVVSLLGLATTSSSLLGAAIGLYVPVSKRPMACLLAFAAGALISALAMNSPMRARCRSIIAATMPARHGGLSAPGLRPAPSFIIRPRSFWNRGAPLYDALPSFGNTR